MAPTKLISQNDWISPPQPDKAEQLVQTERYFHYYPSTSTLSHMSSSRRKQIRHRDTGQPSASSSCREPILTSHCAPPRSRRELAVLPQMTVACSEARAALRRYPRSSCLLYDCLATTGSAVATIAGWKMPQSHGSSCAVAAVAAAGRPEARDTGNLLEAPWQIVLPCFARVPGS